METIMQLSSINNIPFKANLIYKDKKLDSGMLDAPSVSTFGLADTDIFIRRFSSMFNDNKYLSGEENYVNKISFTLDSSLFGRRNFKNIFMGVTPNCNLSSPIEEENYIYKFFTQENVVKNFENETLRHSLLDEINSAAVYNKQTADYTKRRSTDALDILEQRLDRVNCINSNLTPQRISELYNVARELNNQVALEGSTSIINRLA